MAIGRSYQYTDETINLFSKNLGNELCIMNHLFIIITLLTLFLFLKHTKEFVFLNLFNINTFLADLSSSIASNFSMCTMFLLKWSTRVSMLYHSLMIEGNDWNQMILFLHKLIAEPVFLNTKARHGSFLNNYIEMIQIETPNLSIYGYNKWVGKGKIFRNRNTPPPTHTHTHTPIKQNLPSQDQKTPPPQPFWTINVHNMIILWNWIIQLLEHLWNFD